MKAKMFLYGSVPSQKNSKRIFRNKRTGSPILVTDSKVTQWKKGASLAMRASLPRFSCPVSIMFLFTHKTRIRKDLDNSVSTLLDTLKDSKIITDDNCLTVQKLEAQLVGFDSKNFGVEIIIESIQDPLT